MIFPPGKAERLAVHNYNRLVYHPYEDKISFEINTDPMYNDIDHNKLKLIGFVRRSTTQMFEISKAENRKLKTKLELSEEKISKLQTVSVKSCCKSYQNNRRLALKM